MSEAELHWLRQRLLGAKLTKAELGELRFRLPVGLMYDPTGKVALDPDEEVQAAVHLVFSLFEQYGSALAVVKHFTAHHLRFPDRLWKHTQKGELVWEPLRCGRVLSLLHNPFYAGTYVYGRTKTRRHAHAQLAEKTCQTMRGDGIDQMVAACFLEAIQPAHLAVSLSTLDHLEARAKQLDRQWQLRLERAQYEADLARRRYVAVDPDNRLVARSLERDWNEKLAELEQLHREYATVPKPTALVLTPEERQRILR